MTRTGAAGRPAFTLVELLVVMSMVIVLAALAVGVAESGAFGSQKVVSAADRASGWLLVAKQRALRDGRPRGVRFLLSPGGAADYYTSREAQYIEVPEAWTPNPTALSTGPRIVFVYQTGPSSQQVYFASQNPSDVQAGSEFDQRVTAGYMLWLPELGGNYYVNQVGPVTQVTAGGANLSARLLTLGTTTGVPTYPDLGAAVSPTTTPPTATKSTFQFAFVAPPQPLVGEPLLQLTGQTIAIDVRFVQDPPTTGPLVVRPLGPLATTGGVTATGTQHFDVLFTPSGQVLGAPGGLIALWVRDQEKVADPRGAFDQAGEQVLVAVYPRTGAIATHPVTNGTDPHAAAKDGLNSGL